MRVLGIETSCDETGVGIVRGETLLVPIDAVGERGAVGVVDAEALGPEHLGHLVVRRVGDLGADVAAVRRLLRREVNPVGDVPHAHTGAERHVLRESFLPLGTSDVRIVPFARGK